MRCCKNKQQRLKMKRCPLYSTAGKVGENIIYGLFFVVNRWEAGGCPSCATRIAAGGWLS